MKKIMLPVLCVLSTSAMADQKSCEYEVNTDTSYQGVIQSSKNYIRKTVSHENGTRKCLISMEAKVNGKWFPTIGQYIFGPDMTENNACKKAEVKAKENLLRLKVSEKLKSTTKQDCALNVRTVGVKIVPSKKSMVITAVTPVRGNSCAKKWFTVWVGGNKVNAYKEVCR